MRSCLVSQDTSLSYLYALLSHSFMLARPSLISPSATRNLFLICLGFFTIFASIFICCQLLIAVRSVRNKDDRLEEEESKREMEITQEIVERKIFGYKHSVDRACSSNSSSWKYGKRNHFLEWKKRKNEKKIWKNFCCYCSSHAKKSCKSLFAK